MTRREVIAGLELLTCHRALDRADVDIIKQALQWLKEDYDMYKIGHTSAAVRLAQAAAEAAQIAVTEATGGAHTRLAKARERIEIEPV